MNEETQIISKTKAPYEEHREGSHMIGVSIRGWLALILTLTVCLMAGLEIEVKEPLYTVVVMSLSFYFGTKGETRAKSSTISNPTP